MKNPNNANEYFQKGKIYLYQDNYKDALTNYNKSIELNPNIAEFYYNRAVIYDLTNNINKAINDYTKTIELDTKNIEAF
jgi:tetratricopeptide (TPR) repeat protein